MDNEHVECTKDGCEIVLLKSTWGGDQYCSKEHREISELKRELIDVKLNCKTKIDNRYYEITELQAHIERLLRHWFSGRRGTDSWFLKGGGIFHETPKQSLAKHDAEVIRNLVETMSGGGEWCFDDILEYADNLESK